MRGVLPSSLSGLAPCLVNGSLFSYAYKRAIITVEIMTNIDKYIATLKYLYIYI